MRQATKHRLDALERTQPPAPEPQQTTDEILSQWIARGWLVRTDAGVWEARDDAGNPANLLELEGRRRACVAALLNKAEERKRHETEN